MSRRHHGRPHHHGSGGAERWRRNANAPLPGAPEAPATDAPQRPLTNGGDVAAHPRAEDPISRPPVSQNGRAASADVRADEIGEVVGTPAQAGPVNGAAAGRPALTNGHAGANGAAPTLGHNGHGPNGNATNGNPTNGTGTNGNATNGERSGQCTAPQLRRFIKSRPYVPMHELRRRFGIVGDDDDVTAVKLEPGCVYVGLPPREGTLLGDLLRSGEIGYELSLDPRTPIVIGVYPMRPVART